jgi:hypothetical protein
MLAEVQRREVLAAMGIDLYLLRAHAAEVKPVVLSPREEEADTNTAQIALVVALSHGASADPHARKLRKILPHALGISSAHVHWIEADTTGKLSPPPNAGAYLALGQDLPRALGEHLSTTQQMSAVIAVADTPQICMRDALAKRALWQALKPVARHLRRNLN